MAQDILLLKLLYIPVLVIKFISKVISILTYLPNYILIFIFDYIIFHSSLQSSFITYCLSWPIRFIALNLVTALFSYQFITVYNLLQLQDKSWYVQLFAIFFGIGGMLFLMRRGYLQMIAKFNPTKLKSPLQHIQCYMQFFIDLLSIILAVFNIILVTNAHKTLSYKYLTTQQLSQHHNSQTTHPFLQHITSLIHKTLIYNLTFFYTKIFFKLFPWRYIKNLEYVQKQKDNLFNLLVLLTLLFLQTMLDVIVVAILGPVCLMHWKRNMFMHKLKTQQRKYMVALSHFGLIIVQLFIILITLPCIIINFTPTKNHLIKIIQFNSPQGQSQQFTPTLFIQETFHHIFCSLMKLPAYFSLVMILIFRYKYIKFTRVTVHQLNGSAKPVSYWEVDKAYMKLFYQQFVDFFYLPFIIMATLFRPLNIMWLQYVINQKYDVEHSMIMKYFAKCICDLLWFLPLSVIFTTLLGAYCSKKIFTIAKGYFIIYKNQTLLQSITDESLLKKYALTMKKIIINDLPHLPLYFTMTLSLFHLFDSKMQPQNCYTIFQKVIKMFYIHRVKSSPRSDQYFDMFGKDLASGLLQNEGHKMRFWKFAHKCERHILFTKILQMMVPKRRYQKKLLQIEKGNTLSQISNEYWYRHRVTWKMLEIWVFFMIQVMVSLFGLLVLAPLTLWRLPTFIIVYRIHNSKRYFFKVLFQVYKLMCYDLPYLFIHIFGFILSPVSYLKFRKSTIFKYGTVGYTELLKIQKKKMLFISNVLIVQTLKIYRFIMEICTIYAIYMRRSTYRAQLKKKYIYFSFLKQALFKGAKISQFTQLINPKYKFESLQFGLFEDITNQHFIQSLKDLPCLFISLVILLIMPWRYYYLKKALISMKQSVYNRHQVTLVLKNVFKDYLCIFINIILLLSVVKTRKSLEMIRRNYRLNFFVGFLKYQYLKQLLYQLKQCIRIYFSMFLLAICLIIDWQHCDQLIKRLYAYYKENKQLQDTRRQNERMYMNTIKQKKDHKMFDRIGFFQYVGLCQFLTVKQLAQLARVNKMNYLLLQRQQIWIQKWQNNYSQKYQSSIQAQTYKQRCIKAYQLQSMNIKSKKVTFNQLSRLLFIYHTYEKKTDLVQILEKNCPLKIKQKYFKNYTWSVYEGYGPQNELPQQENEDEQFLRLTNQVRRQRIQLKPDDKFYFDYLFVKPIETISQLLNSFYRVDDKRRLKQFSFIVLVVIVPYLLVKLFFSMLWSIFSIDRWIGVKLLLTAYTITFTYLLFYRLKTLYTTSWTPLTPFDLYYDIKNFIIKLIKFIRIKLILIKNILFTKVYTPMKTRIISIIKFITKWIKKITNFIINKIKYVSKQFVDKVAAPFYLYCVQKLIAIKNVIVMIYKTTKQFIIFILKLLKRLMITFYETVKLILNNMNNLYFNMLLYSRRVLMKFGLLGELIFTIFGLFLMTLPSIICYFVYSQRWYVVVSTVHSAVLVVLGYRHLNKIKLQRP